MFSIEIWRFCTAKVTEASIAGERDLLPVGSNMRRRVRAPSSSHIRADVLGDEEATCSSILSPLAAAFEQDRDAHLSSSGSSAAVSLTEPRNEPLLETDFSG
jgi:hypothetical protein